MSVRTSSLGAATEAYAGLRSILLSPWGDVDFERAIADSYTQNDASVRNTSGQQPPVEIAPRGIAGKRAMSGAFVLQTVGDEESARSPGSPVKTRSGEASYAPNYAFGPNSQVVDGSMAEVVAAWRLRPTTTCGLQITGMFWNCPTSACSRAAPSDDGTDRRHARTPAFRGPAPRPLSAHRALSAARSLRAAKAVNPAS
jgi:hypothetical protein